MRTKIVTTISLALLLIFSSVAFAETKVPEGWRSGSLKILRPGVVHQRLLSDGPAQSANVARISPSADVAFRPMVAGGQLISEHRAARTSAMCQIISCILAVNGDFFDLQSSLPLGGLFYRGEVLRTPNPFHHQLVFAPDGDLTFGPMQTQADLVTSDLKKTSLAAINRERTEDQLVAFTPAWGDSTETNPHGLELVGRISEPAGPLRLGQTVRISIVARHEGGDAKIPKDGIVLSGHGSQASWLEALWSSISQKELSREVLLRVDGAPRGIDSIGGTPVLVRDSKVWFKDEATSFVRGRHPRTMIGRTADGEVLVVTVDGRQPGYSEGMSLAEAARFMLSLGAVEALNLDGGGSTTFVTEGHVINRPSDRLVKRSGEEKIVAAPRRSDFVIGNVERPVPVALALVPRGVVARPTQDPLQGLSLPRVYALPLPQSDPGSRAGDRLSSMPALVGPPAQARPTSVAVAASLAHLILAAALVVYRRRRSHWET